MKLLTEIKLDCQETFKIAVKHTIIHDMKLKNIKMQNFHL